MQPALLILAAGMGSRYGGLKQLDPMGPDGETVLDYSVRDAAAAGFGKVVFVIRRDFEEAFRTAVGRRLPGGLEPRFCFQQLDDLPPPFRPPAGRTRPWGTAHAVRAARDQIAEPFAVINADDFYGRDAFVRLAGWAARQDPARLAACMVGYPLRNTLSRHGSVNRGICRIRDGLLQSIEEHTGITAGADGVRGSNAAGETVPLDPAAAVSMNFWGFTPPLFGALEARFKAFLEDHGESGEAECYLPAVVDDLIGGEGLACPVLETGARWFGVTYPEDKPAVMAGIRALIEAGEYPG